MGKLSGWTSHCGSLRLILEDISEAVRNDHSVFSVIAQILCIGRIGNRLPFQDDRERYLTRLITCLAGALDDTVLTERPAHCLCLFCRRALKGPEQWRELHTSFGLVATAGDSLSLFIYSSDSSTAEYAARLIGTRINLTTELAVTCARA